MLGNVENIQVDRSITSLRIDMCLSGKYYGIAPNREVAISTIGSYIYIISCCRCKVVQSNSTCTYILNCALFRRNRSGADDILPVAGSGSWSEG